MADENADNPEGAAEPTKKARSPIVGTLLSGVGIFVIVVAAQLITPMIAARLLPHAQPGAATSAGAGEETAAEEAEPAEPELPAQYIALDPPLISSFEDENAIRFLSVTVELMARKQETLDAITKHMPVIRNNLLMLLGSASVKDLVNREGKEKLRQDALVEVQKVIEQNTGQPGVENLYFTSFVVQ